MSKVNPLLFIINLVLSSDKKLKVLNKDERWQYVQSLFDYRKNEKSNKPGDDLFTKDKKVEVWEHVKSMFDAHKKEKQAGSAS